MWTEKKIELIRKTMSIKLQFLWFGLIYKFAIEYLLIFMTGWFSRFFFQIGIEVELKFIFLQIIFDWYGLRQALLLISVHRSTN